VPEQPVISIGPILAVPGVRDALVARRERVVAVSPIIAGRPVKGPADRLMGPLGIDVSCVGVAREYRAFCATLVIDAGDAARVGEIERWRATRTAETLMTARACRGTRARTPWRRRVAPLVAPARRTASITSVAQNARYSRATPTHDTSMRGTHQRSAGPFTGRPAMIGLTATTRSRRGDQRVAHAGKRPGSDRSR